MTAATIGELVGPSFVLIVAFFVIGVFASLNWIWRKAWRYSAKPTARRSF